jgi:hypothetical protein
MRMRRRDKRVIEGENLIKVHCMYLCKYHNETQFRINMH